MSDLVLQCFSRRYRYPCGKYRPNQDIGLHTPRHGIRAGTKNERRDMRQGVCECPPALADEFLYITMFQLETDNHHGDSGCKSSEYFGNLPDSYWWLVLSLERSLQQEASCNQIHPTVSQSRSRSIIPESKPWPNKIRNLLSANSIVIHREKGIKPQPWQGRVTMQLVRGGGSATG